MTAPVENLDVDARRKIIQGAGLGSAEHATALLAYEKTLTTVGMLVERSCALLELGEQKGQPFGLDEMRRLRTMLERARALSRPIIDGRIGAQLEPKDDQTLDVFSKEQP